VTFEDTIEYVENDVRVDTYSDDSVVLAVSQAQQHGIKVLGLAGAIWPLNDQVLLQMVSETLLAELVAFCIHARRVMENKKIRDVKLQGQLWKLSEGAREAEYEDDLWRALNVILHANKLEVVAIETTPTRAFEKLGDRSIAHIAATSMKDGTKLVCPTALAYAFLTYKPN
jgi:hypothetical protein